MKFRVIFLLMAACTFFTSYAAEKDKYLNIVYIGNSITYGAGVEDRLHNAPPVKASMFLRQKPDIKSVQFSNQGVSGATTVDFLPSTNTLFPKVTAAADQFATEDWAMLLFSVMLGTNDSAIKGPNGSPVSPSQYKENMKTILDALLEKYPGCKIVVHRPIWYSPNTHNGALYLKEGLKRLKKYYPQLKRLVKEYRETYPGRVFLGDTGAFNYYEKYHLTKVQAEDGNSGVFYLHPNKEGAADLGQFWCDAIYSVLK